ncbi:MAG: type IV pilus secretin PilQ [Candidatus Endonucleobacter bathymodioli]|uniref:Type IV pilus secretin PilQ n=1 Tax=Candidatus Endonucleibacter bathymodioli TaxID=539814 RepID=A0AA90NPV1_9GAMM|nr:type IV pilus secretin PilQ [Candidatus Endonucleobacter bathymodioli]
MDIKYGQSPNRLIVIVYGILLSLSFPVWSVGLKDMKAVTKADGLVELVLFFDGPAPDAEGYSIAHPPRVSIDLPDTISALPRYNDLGFDVAQSVTVLQVDDKTRLIITQKKSAVFSHRKAGNTIYVSIGSTAAVSTAAVSTAATNYVSASQKSSDSYLDPAYSSSPLSEGLVSKEISLIDFRRGEEGAGNIIVTFSGSSIPIDISEVSGRIRVEFEGNVLPEKLRNRLDVIDFATPVKYIEANIENGNSVVMIESKGEYDYLAYQTDNKLTISVKPIEKVTGSGRGKKPSYRGDKVSFNFQDIEIRSVLQIIAEVADLNLVASAAVAGRVTLRLKNIPWDHALDIVLSSYGLDKRMKGNVLTVAPAGEIAAREKQQLADERQLRELEPVYTNLIQVNYADAAEIASVLGGRGGDRILTERGSVQVVERTNSLLINDTQSKLDEIRDLLSLIDIPIKQVQIEARIVNLSTVFKKELGVKWSGGATSINNNRGLIVGGGGTKFPSSDMSNIGDTVVSDNIFTDIGTSDKVASLGIGFVTNGTLLNLELSALLSDGGGEVISQPKIITADKQTALIKSGKQIPYTEASSSGAATVSFKDALLSLEVTPQITPDGRVILDIKITNDDSTSTTKSGIPIVDKNEIKTQVLVRDGETLVLGGVFKQTQKSNVDKVPILGDIPFLGALFRRTTKRDDKSELMVFITPRIIYNNDSKTLR